jgi:hypothetical protein
MCVAWSLPSKLGTEQAAQEALTCIPSKRYVFSMEGLTHVLVQASACLSAPQQVQVRELHKHVEHGRTEIEAINAKVRESRSHSERRVKGYSVPSI